MNDKNNESQVPSISESSPLNKNRKSIREIRRLSSTEKIMSGIQKAVQAFELEVRDFGDDDDDNDNDNDYYDDDDDDDFHDEALGRGVSATSMNKYENKVRKGKQTVSCSCLISLLVFFLAFVFTLGALTWHFVSVARYKRTTSEYVTVDSMKGMSYIDGLSNGAVASDQKICSELGTNILISGGNAIDAAVTTTICLGIVNPSSSGFGGGAFIMVHADKSNFEQRSKALNFPPFSDARDPDMVLNGDKVVEVIDCRETAPGAASEDMYQNKPDSASSFGGLAVPVPGELRGLELMHARHGKMAWSDLLQPVIPLAERGVPVSAHLAKSIKEVAEVKAKKYGIFAPLRRYLTKDDDWGTYLREGQVLRNPQLAKTLKEVAKVGSDGLYRGSLAKGLVRDVADEGGILTVHDLENYRPTIRSPVIGEMSGFTIVGVPPPSSGGATMIGAARFLSGYRTPLASFPRTLSVHRMVESLRHSFAIRMSLCDPDFFPDKTKSAVHDLTTGPYMESLRQMTFDNDTLPLSLYGGAKWAQLDDDEGKKEAIDAHEGDRRSLLSRNLARPFGYLEDSGTSHFSIVDKDGNAVSMTTSVNQIFGSYVFSESTGILLGNTMDDFGNPGRSNYYGLKPAVENFIAPGKRPLSSMSPTFVFHNENEETIHEDEQTTSERKRQLGKLMLVVGGSGGPKIISAVLQVILNYCFLGMNLFDSMTRPRVHEQLMYHDSPVTTTERDALQEGPLIEVPQETKDALLRRGHDALLDIDYAGTVQAISMNLETNTLSAVADIRKGGSPYGY